MRCILWNISTIIHYDVKCSVIHFVATHGDKRAKLSMFREENLKESDCYQGICVDRRITVRQVLRK